jgi:phage repressor protein C with HTH and peptisase S24 domain
MDITQGELADKASTTYASIGRIERGQQVPGTAMIMNLANALNVPVGALMKDMVDDTAVFVRSDPSGLEIQTPDIYASIPYANRPHGDISGETVHLPHYKINVAAGGGMLVDEPVINEELPFKMGWLRNRLRTSIDNLFLVDVWGDSMEPTLYEGDTVLIDKSKVHLKTGGLYVFRDDGMLYVKRVEKQVDGRVLIISDNQRYKPYYFDPDVGENKVFGRVVWYARTVI